LHEQQKQCNKKGANKRTYKRLNKKPMQFFNDSQCASKIVSCLVKKSIFERIIDFHRQMIFKKFGLVLVVIFSSLFSFSQMDKPSEKKLKKASRCVKKERFKEAGEYVKSVIQKYPVNEDLWNYYQEIYLRNYNKNYKPDMRVSVVPSKKDTTLNVAGFEEMLNSIFVQPKFDYFNAVYDASLYMPFNMKSSGVMRVYHIDPKYYNDSAVSKSSKDKLRKANEEFNAKNYLNAIGLAKEAYSLDSSNYPALVKIGLSYFQVGYYGDAARYFRDAIKAQPNLNEPRKYLADALNRKGEKQQALEVLKESLLIYPEESSFVKITKLLGYTGSKKLDRQWVLRLAKINTVENPHKREQFFEDAMHFEHYKTAFEEVKESYTAEGIIKEDVTTSYHRYLEIECWKRMLLNTQGQDIPALDYARVMQSKGLLEAYIFISLFNVDLYDQYVDYVAHNKSKTERYINNYLITN
jgi:tetratricopeptide (TPR) repeat protein